MERRGPSMANRVLFGWELGEGNGHLRPYLSLLRALGGRRVGGRASRSATPRSRPPSSPPRAGPSSSRRCAMNEFSGHLARPRPTTRRSTWASVSPTPKRSLGLVGGWRVPVPGLRARSRHRQLRALAACSRHMPPACRPSASARDSATRRTRDARRCIRPWSPGLDERLERAETHALRTANAVLRALGRPPWPGSRPRSTERHAPRDGSRIDPFHRRAPATRVPRPAARFTRLAGAAGRASGGIRLAAHGPPPRGGRAAGAGGTSGLRVWAYVPDATPDWCARISTGDMLVSSRPFDMPTALSSCRAVVTYGGQSVVVSQPPRRAPAAGPARHRGAGPRRDEGRALGAGIAVGRTSAPRAWPRALKRILQEAAFTEAARKFEELTNPR